MDFLIVGNGMFAIARHLALHATVTVVGPWAGWQPPVTRMTATAFPGLATTPAAGARGHDRPAPAGLRELAFGAIRRTQAVRARAGHAGRDARNRMPSVPGLAGHENLAPQGRRSCGCHPARACALGLTADDRARTHPRNERFVRSGEAGTDRAQQGRRPWPRRAQRPRPGTTARYPPYTPAAALTLRRARPRSPPTRTASVTSAARSSRMPYGDCASRQPFTQQVQVSQRRSSRRRPPRLPQSHRPCQSPARTCPGLECRSG